MERRVAALKLAGTSVEFHIYPGLGHGFGLGPHTVAEGWIKEAIRFWTENGEKISPLSVSADTGPRGSMDAQYFAALISIETHR